MAWDPGVRSPCDYIRSSASIVVWIASSNPSRAVEVRGRRFLRDSPGRPTPRTRPCGCGPDAGCPAPEWAPVLDAYVRDLVNLHQALDIGEPATLFSLHAGAYEEDVLALEELSHPGGSGALFRRLGSAEQAPQAVLLLKSDRSSSFASFRIFLWLASRSFPARLT